MGHLAMRCPKNALFCQSEERHSLMQVNCQAHAESIDAGSEVDDILLDTGCSCPENLVPIEGEDARVLTVNHCMSIRVLVNS